MIWLGKSRFISDAKIQEIRNSLNAIWEASENLRACRQNIYTVASNSSITAQPHITVQPVLYSSDANTATSTTVVPTTWAEWATYTNTMIAENPF